MDISYKEFTEKLASKLPSPGGGGASALALSLGISLGDMVGEFTVGKEKYKDVESDILKLMKRAQEIRVRALELIDLDEVAFIPLSKAYSIPKDDPNRDIVMEECLKNALKVPLEIFDLSIEALDILFSFREKGSKIILSDAYTGISLTVGALKGAYINTKVNSRLLKDVKYKEEIEEYLDSKLNEYIKKADKEWQNF